MNIVLKRFLQSTALCAFLLNDAAAGTAFSRMASALSLDEDFATGIPRTPSYAHTDLHVRALSERVITDTMSEHAKRLVTEAILEIPADQRDAVLAAAHSFFTTSADDHRASIIKTVAAVPADQLDTILAAVHRLMPEDMDGLEKAAVIKSVYTFSADLCAAAAAEPRQRAQGAMFLQDIYKLEIATLVNAIAAIDASEREDVLSAAHRFMTRGDKTRSSGLIKAVAAIPADQRTDMLDAVWPFMTEGMTLIDKVNFIKTVAMIPADQRTDILRVSQPLMTPGMSSPNKTQLILNVYSLSANEREGILAAVRPLITEDIEGTTATIIIQIMNRLSADQRANFSQAMQLFVPGRFSSDHDVVRIVNAFEYHGMPNLLAHAQQAHQALERDITQGGLQTNQMLRRVVQLIESPRA